MTKGNSIFADYPLLSIPIVALLLVLTAAAPGQSTGRTSASAQANVAEPHQGTDALISAKSLVEGGNFAEAERILRLYLSNHQSSGEAHFLLGYVLFRQIQTKAALEGRIDPEFQQKNAKAALAEFTQGARSNRPSAFDLKIVALCYVLLGDYADADKWLTKSLDLDSADLESWYYLGRAKYNEQRFEEAISAFKQCLLRDPGSVRAEDNLGLAYAGLDRYEEAIAAYQTAIGWQDKSLIKDSGPYIDLGSLLIDQNRAAEAIPYLSQGVAISPEESRGYAALGKAYFKTNDLEKAQKQLEKAVEFAPDNASLHYVLGQIYRRQGMLDKARAEFSRTAELNGSHSSPVNDRPGNPPPKSQ